MVLAASRKNRVKLFKVATLQRQAYLQPCNVPFREVIKFGGECREHLFKGVLCPSESPRHLYSRSAESVIVGYTL